MRRQPSIVRAGREGSKRISDSIDCVATPRLPCVHAPRGDRVEHALRAPNERSAGLLQPRHRYGQIRRRGSEDRFNRRRGRADPAAPWVHPVSGSPIPASRPAGHRSEAACVCDAARLERRRLGARPAIRGRGRGSRGRGPHDHLTRPSRICIDAPIRGAGGGPLPFFHCGRARCVARQHAAPEVHRPRRGVDSLRRHDVDARDVSRRVSCPAGVCRARHERQEEGAYGNCSRDGGDFCRGVGLVERLAASPDRSVGTRFAEGAARPPVRQQPQCERYLQRDTETGRLTRWLGIHPKAPLGGGKARDTEIRVLLRLSEGRVERATCVGSAHRTIDVRRGLARRMRGCRAKRGIGDCTRGRRGDPRDSSAAQRTLGPPRRDRFDAGSAHGLDLLAPIRNPRASGAFPPRGDRPCDRCPVVMAARSRPGALGRTVRAGRVGGGGRSLSPKCVRACRGRRPRWTPRRRRRRRAGEQWARSLRGRTPRPTRDGHLDGRILAERKVSADARLACRPGG